MPSTGRRGFSLIELMIALVMVVIVAGGLYKVLNAVQRVSGRQTQVSNMQGNLRTGIQLIQGEIQELSTNGSPNTDILNATATSLRYRAMRGIGETCAASSATEIRLRKEFFSGLQEPLAGRHGLMVLINANPNQNNDTWEARAITAVDLNGTCADGDPAYVLTIGAITVAQTEPSPVRLFEEMEIGQIVDAGENWLGIRSVSGGEATLIPVVGPLQTPGVLFEYFDLNGNPNATPATTRRIQITLFGASAEAAHSKMDGTVETLSDTMVVRVQLRNSL